MSGVSERGLTKTQIDLLLRPLDEHRVQHANGQAHLAAWDIRRWLLRVFGWGGWDFTVLSCDLVHQSGEVRRRKNKQGQEYGDPYTAWTVVYRALGQLTIRDPHGNVVASYQDGATGDAVNQPVLGDAHDLALKTSLSQTLKRCAANLGDGFGLSLYNAASVEPVVIRSMAHGAGTDHAEPEVHADEGVPAQAPDEAQAAPDAPSRRDVLRQQVMTAAAQAGIGGIPGVRDDYAGWSQGAAIADADDDTLAQYRDHLIARGGEDT